LLDVKGLKLAKVATDLLRANERGRPNLLLMTLEPSPLEVTEQFRARVVKRPELLFALDIDPIPFRVPLTVECLASLSTARIAPPDFPTALATGCQVTTNRRHDYMAPGGDPSRNRFAASISSEYKKRRLPPGSL